jgi:hypothetical protein
MAQVVTFDYFRLRCPMQTQASDIPILLEETRHGDPRVRQTAVRHLCPCHVKRNNHEVWDRMLSMASDPDVKVRRWVLHVLTDGSPRSRKAEVLQILEKMRDDPDTKVRRRARQILASYRRAGVLNIS